MRVFYIGPLNVGGTCLDRLRSIEKLGHEVIPFDTSIYTNTGYRPIRIIGSRFNRGPYVNKINKVLIDISENLTNVDVIWIDKGNWIRPNTLKILKTSTTSQLVHYTPDAAFKHHRSHLFDKAVHLYDHCFTTKTFEMQDYWNHEAKHVHLTQQAYEESRFYPRPKVRAYESDVCFIGHFERHYARRLKAVARSGVRLAIWGPGWTRYAYFARWCRGVVRGDGVWGDAYPQALCSAKICLGLLSKIIPETSTTRTFEIPASARLLLAERTEEHLSFFREGKEADFFDSDSELVRKIIFYLSNKNIRDEIARAGRKRCLQSGYDNVSKMAKAFDIISMSMNC